MDKFLYIFIEFTAKDLPSRHNIRKFEETPIVKNLRKDEVSKKIESFFILHEDGTKWKFIE